MSWERRGGVLAHFGASGKFSGGTDENPRGHRRAAKESQEAPNSSQETAKRHPRAFKRVPQGAQKFSQKIPKALRAI